MKEDLLDAKIKGIASGSVTGTELYNSLLELEASGRILVQGEIFDYSGLKAVLATSKLSKSYPYLRTGGQ